MIRFFILNVILGCAVMHAVSIRVSNVSEITPKDWAVLVQGENFFFSINEEGYLITPEDPENTQLSIPSGDYVFEFLKEGIILKKDIQITEEREISLVLNVDEKKRRDNIKTKRLSEVKVADRGSLSLSGNSRLTQEQARFIPGAGGDILRSLFTLPGVLTSTTFGRDLIIRGGSGDDVLYQYDDFRIGNPFHFIPPFSAFPNEMLKELDFFPGGFNTSYVGVQGSVVDISGKPFLPTERWHGGFSAQIENSYLWTTVPIKQRAKFSLSTRRSYAEYIFKILERAADDLFSDFDTIPFFTDVNTRLDVNLAKGHDLLFVGVYSQDGLSVKTESFQADNERGEEEDVAFQINFREQWWTTGLKYTWDLGYLKQAWVLNYYLRRDKLAFFGDDNNVEMPSTIDFKWRGDLELRDNLFLEMGTGYVGEIFPFSRKQFTSNDILALAEDGIAQD